MTATERLIQAALALLITVPALSGCAAEDRTTNPSVEGQLYAARAEHADFLRAYREISTGYETTTTGNRALLDAYLEAEREYDAAHRAYQEASRRLGLALYNNETVQVVGMDYRRAMARAERDDDPIRARQQREAAQAEYDAAFQSAVEDTPIPGYVDAENTAYHRLEDAWGARLAARRTLAKAAPAPSGK